jgi:hypothetical protein
VVYVYDQKPLQASPVLVPPDQAQLIIDRFRTNYSKMESPRLLIYVNRTLTDELRGLRALPASETNGYPAAATRRVVEDIFRSGAQPAPTLTDRQMGRDVERLFGRPLRMAGATVIDEQDAVQALAGQLGSNPPPATAADAASAEREALAKVADVVVEVLITYRNVNVPEVTGERVYTLPEIQATAIRLRDQKIVGQATAGDVMSRQPSLSYAARSFGVPEITEGTALALMDDMTPGDARP